MKLKILFAALLAALVATPFTASPVLAAKAKAGRGAAFVFRGQLAAAPSPGATSLSVTVKGGNRLALRKMLGASTTQSFAVGANTVYLKWTNGVPSLAQLSDLAAGDRVTIRVRAPRKATLAEITAQPAIVVAAHSGTASKPKNPLFLFRATLSAAPSNGKLSVHVLGGNKRALRRLLGQSQDQTFSYDANTHFILWKGHVPSVISPDQLTAGEKIVIRVRAPRGSTLAQIEATPANVVAAHEKASP